MKEKQPEKSDLICIVNIMIIYQFYFMISLLFLKKKILSILKREEDKNRWVVMLYSLLQRIQELSLGLPHE